MTLNVFCLVELSMIRGDTMMYLYMFLVSLMFSTHAFMCSLSVTGINRLIQSCCCLHLQLIDSS